MNELSKQIAEFDEKKSQETAWKTETERAQKLQFQQVADRLGFDSYEEVLPTLCDRAIAPTELLAQKMLACLRCPVCCRIANRPVETSCCGHVICYRCLSRVQELQMGCPICRCESVQGQTNRLARRLIGVCDIKCPCCEVGLPESCLTDHLNTCPEYPLICHICLEHSIPRKQGELHDSLRHPDYFKEFSNQKDHKGINRIKLAEGLFKKYRTPYPPK